MGAANRPPVEPTPPPPSAVRRTTTPEPAVDRAVSMLRMSKATQYSLMGLAAAWREEASFRFEVILGIMLFPAAIFLPMGLAFKGLLCASMFMVLAMECINSAVEACVDYISAERHPLAKRAKDLGSAAVFFCLLNCGSLWVIAVVEHWQRWFAIWR
ncbi:MAG: diacylglycerol kinase [Verrucomicrobiota bacterium JB022]|nr:diacylglycerol kinase [Verrucomicrobiota bacterium JB022]